MEKVREGISWYIIDFTAVVHRSVSSGKKIKIKYLLCSEESKHRDVWYVEAPSQKCTLNDNSVT